MDIANSPKTIEALRVGIEELFRVKGKWTTQYAIVGDGQKIHFTTYIIGAKSEGEEPRADAYWPTPELAIAAMWDSVLKIKNGTRERSSHDGDDYGRPGADFQCAPATEIYWRVYPELITHPNGIYTVRMRAAFT
jgi:hypothetical protein